MAFKQRRFWTILHRVLFFPIVPVKKRKSRWTQMLLHILTFLVVLYLALCVFALLFANRMIFPAPKASYSDDKSIIRLPIKDGSEIAAIYLENPDAEYTILYSHGNAEDLGHILPHLKELHKRGFAVMAYDYPGYGLSDGRVGEQGSYEAAAAAFSYLVILRDVDPEKIILYGRSLGSGPSFEIASKRAVAGLIIDGGFASTFRVMTRKKIVPWDIFDNLGKVDDISSPVLLIHGTQDRTVPFSHAQTMKEALEVPVTTLFVEGAGHNNLIESAHDDYWDAIINFRESLKE
ncbi:alpha/beta hydrolase [Rubellicoccus peritrichatus]|uniref:Alpha/beta hydrolase n=1 Tax=Rubellicoccus peritrichatus TaxID=3080537 RepID=A0AAQ3L904_9BACT|nr:alpha/beta hydrolase [Puniceicoccus sp. CR14]WOO41051.1 alpha/beta hydrolase [Puniceicoccus sp. CR14]